jgi:UDP-N-acetylglucosamine--N-acetylmuramyl-(pentapeptide) pyrophosphoryl-undecaprenol N-acetylglucosamine transferase
VWDHTAARFRPSARRVLGMPLRPGFAPSAYVARAGARVLVMGGSQGAAALNERMPEAIARLGDLPGLEVIHQAGRDRDGAVRDAYRRAKVERVDVVPFIDDVAKAIANADVVVARAGAGTIAEVTAVGRAALLVPFPHATDDHQARNAEALVRAGGAISIRQELTDPGRLAAELRRLLEDSTARVAMADASRAQGRPRAAHDVAADLLELAGIPRSSRTGKNGGTRTRVPAPEVS